MRALAEGSHLIFDIQGGGHFSGYVLKLVDGVVLLKVHGEAPNPGTEVQLRHARELGDEATGGKVVVVSGQSIAIRLESIEARNSEGQPAERLKASKTPIMWISDDQHVTLQMTGTSTNGFEFESAVDVPVGTEQTFQIAISGQFHTVKGKVLSCQKSGAGPYSGEVTVQGNSRLDQTEWTACRRAA